MTDLQFDEDATRKIAAFLNQLATLNASAVSRAQQRFPRALNAVYRRAQETGNVAAAVVAYYDGDATHRVFDSLADAYDAALEYKEDNAPYVVFSMTNVNVVPTRRANEC